VSAEASRDYRSPVAEADLAAVGSLLAHPSRVLMLDALMAGRALTAGELGRVSGVKASTASEHLSRLREGGLVEMLAQGRHRYYRLSGAEVALALEALSLVAPPRPVRTLTQSARARSLLDARLCYDHIAGRRGVALHDGFQRRGWLVPAVGGYDLTPDGASALSRWGVDVESARSSRRVFACDCLDWTERRHHLGGALGRALAAALGDGADPWFVRRGDDHRGLRLSVDGGRRIEELAD
jgi:DNA-binding transcriptional ArsR family regulator